MLATLFIACLPYDRWFRCSPLMLDAVVIMLPDLPDAHATPLPIVILFYHIIATLPRSFMRLVIHCSPFHFADALPIARAMTPPS